LAFHQVAGLFLNCVIPNLIPKRRLRVLVLFWLSSALLFAQAPQAKPPTAVQPPDNSPHIISPDPAHKFPLNTTLTYSAEWRLFNAGTATMRMESAGREHRIYATADAQGFVAVLYHVHDIFEAFFDPATLCSLNITKHSEEGFRRHDTNVVFDYARKKSVLNEKNLKTVESKHDENDIPGCVTDIVSSPFYIASLPLTNGSVYRFPLNDGGKTVNARATVEGRDEVKTPVGTYKTVRVNVVADSGSLMNKGQVWIWFSDDAARTPVQMKARLFWGTLVFHLQKMEISPQR
jgi:hypothetical protein